MELYIHQLLLGTIQLETSVAYPQTIFLTHMSQVSWGLADLSWVGLQAAFWVQVCSTCLSSSQDQQARWDMFFSWLWQSRKRTHPITPAHFKPLYVSYLPILPAKLKVTGQRHVSLLKWWEDWQSHMVGCIQRWRIGDSNSTWLREGWEEAVGYLTVQMGGKRKQRNWKHRLWPVGDSWGHLLYIPSFRQPVLIGGWAWSSVRLWVGHDIARM